MRRSRSAKLATSLIVGMLLCVLSAPVFAFGGYAGVPMMENKSKRPQISWLKKTVWRSSSARRIKRWFVNQRPTRFVRQRYQRHIDKRRASRPRYTRRVGWGF